MARGHEHRRHQRVAPLAGRPVEIQLMGGEFLDVLLAKDISVGGVAVLVPHAFEGTNLAEEVELVIKLPGRTAFMARGTIRHIGSDACLFGVEFTRLEADPRRKLAEYVEELTARGRGV